jgi:uncharacterized membrane protein
MMVGLSVALYVILTFIPRIDPFWKTIQPRYNVLMMLRDIVLGFILAIFLMILFSTKEGTLPLNLLGICLGVLIALIGNYLPKIPRNWFFGIRSPWTLASDVVWVKTHRLGGWVFFVAGILTVILSLLGVHLEIILVGILLPVALYTAILYPFVLYRRIQRDDNGDSADVADTDSTTTTNKTS